MKKTLNDLQKLAEHVFEVSEESDKYALIVLGCPSGGNQATFEIYEPRKGHEDDLSNTFTVDMVQGWESELYAIVEAHLVEFYCYEPADSEGVSAEALCLLIPQKVNQLLSLAPIKSRLNDKWAQDMLARIRSELGRIEGMLTLEPSLQELNWLVRHLAYHATSEEVKEVCFEIYDATSAALSLVMVDQSSN